MDARDLIIIAAGAAALMLFSRRASASPVGVPMDAPAAWGGQWWAEPTSLAPTLATGGYTAPTVWDVEDAEIFTSQFPGYSETLTPVDDEWLDYPGDSQGAALEGEIMQASAGGRNLDAMLRLIRRLEVGTDGPEGYARVHTAVAKVIGQSYLTDLRDHPRVRAKYGRSTTSAAGGYQFQEGTWDEAARALGLPDFTPASQDKAAAYLITRRGAMTDILGGKIRAAIAKLKNEWASLPGGAEPQMSDGSIERLFTAYGGALAPGEGGTAYA